MKEEEEEEEEVVVPIKTLPVLPTVKKSSPARIATANKVEKAPEELSSRRAARNIPAPQVAPTRGRGAAPQEATPTKGRQAPQETTTRGRSGRKRKVRALFYMKST